MSSNRRKSSSSKPRAVDPAAETGEYETLPDEVKRELDGDPVTDPDPDPAPAPDVTPPARPSAHSGAQPAPRTEALHARIAELEGFIKNTLAHGLNYTHAAEILKKKV